MSHRCNALEAGLASVCAQATRSCAEATGAPKPHRQVIDGTSRVNAKAGSRPSVPQHQPPSRPPPMIKPRPFKLQCLAQAAVLLLAAHAAQAQETRLDRVEVTGSSIKRLDGE